MDYASQFTSVGAGSMLSGHWFPPHVLCTCLCRLLLMYTPCVYTDDSPGVGSLVAGEFTQSLGARLLVSVLRAVGAICNLDFICFTLDS